MCKCPQCPPVPLLSFASARHGPVLVYSSSIASIILGDKQVIQLDTLISPHARNSEDLCKGVSNQLHFGKHVDRAGLENSGIKSDEDHAKSSARNSGKSHARKSEDSCKDDDASSGSMYDKDHARSSARNLAKSSARNPEYSCMADRSSSGSEYAEDHDHDLFKSTDTQHEDTAVSRLLKSKDARTTEQASEDSCKNIPRIGIKPDAKTRSAGRSAEDQSPIRLSNRFDALASPRASTDSGSSSASEIEQCPDCSTPLHFWCPKCRATFSYDE